MNDNISFNGLKQLLKISGYGVSEAAGLIGVSQSALSGMCTGKRIPMTDTVAKISALLKVHPSEFVSFEGVKENEVYFGKEKRESLPKESKGELTYKPLWCFMSEYQRGHKGKTANDLFDRIETGRKTSEKYKGLSEEIRTKLRNDRPLNMSVIYEICKFLGCSIDFVMGYK